MTMKLSEGLRQLRPTHQLTPREIAAGITLSDVLPGGDFMAHPAVAPEPAAARLALLRTIWWRGKTPATMRAWMSIPRVRHDKREG